MTPGMNELLLLLKQPQIVRLIALHYAVKAEAGIDTAKVFERYLLGDEPKK